VAAAVVPLRPTLARRYDRAMPCVLFLDDDHERHRQFRMRVEQLGYRARYLMLYVFSAGEAIQALRDHEGEIVQAFLDHDLSLDDLCVAVGAPTRVPTGMTVVDHIVTMRAPPGSIVVHSLNHSAAVEMCARLAALGTVAVRQVPFTLMLSQLA
jgi:CheY-like chemotaxis protein